MRSRCVLLAAVLLAVSAGPTPARPVMEGDVTVPTPGTAPAVTFARLTAPWQQVTRAAAGWLDTWPAWTDDLRVTLAVRVRDAAVHTQLLAAAVLPTWSDDPDLTPLTASPVPGVESSGFGWRRDPIHRRRKFHRGTDFRADRGTPVHVAGAGVVTFCGRQHGYGKVIYVDHGGGIETRYAHLSRIEVHEGDVVAAATRIGRVGSTGRTTGPHLHFEIRLAGRAVDPVVAMAVAETQRTDPDAGHRAARTLGADVQERRVDHHDPPRRRPPRPGGPVRDRTLW